MTAQTARAAASRRLLTQVTRDPELVLQAQRLRYDVFSAEYDSDLGAEIPGLDADPFDQWCDHLMVTDSTTGELVATTRILRQDQIVHTGGFYSESEFDLSQLLSRPGRVAELGRTCVHPDYRTGATIGLLWATLAAWLTEHRVDRVIGCASISMSDGGLKAWRIARHLQDRYLSSGEDRVWPRRSLPHLTRADSGRPVDIPALIRAYMRLGARVCGEPCWDPEFRCADVLVLLEVSELSARYSRHFMRRSSAPE
ncbi:GNAT family N-acetyltransferase [Marinobacter lacisalsi]|uniref:L-ornithine N(alpha)-acyltransferase n=1 Tax=Marinobacter lacisalsi TaxID=475979 RepID=A0ABV8QH66_9GAMM